MKSPSDQNTLNESVQLSNAVNTDPRWNVDNEFSEAVGTGETSSSVQTLGPCAPLTSNADASEEVSAGWIRRSFRMLSWTVTSLFNFASLVFLLALLTAIPLLQLIAFGYLLDVAGRLALGAKLSESLPNLSRAGMVGLAVVSVFVASLPTQLLVHWESVAHLINPQSSQASLMRTFALGTCFVAIIYLLWAWIRGGRLRNYLWPEPKRFLREAWRPSTWTDAPDRLWEFTSKFEMPRLFWLGARGVLGTLIWLIPAMLLIIANRQGNSGVAGLVGITSILTLGVILLYLPMLQVHFAAENRLKALFEVRTIRRDFRRAPWAWFWAMFVGLVLMPIPLYLLKIEATPREVVWLPCLVFVAFILPARLAEGLALRRARRRPEPEGRWAALSRWAVRLLMPGVIGIYMVFLQISQYTSWDGLQTWIQQHAILIPIPFLDAV